MKLLHKYQTRVTETYYEWRAYYVFDSDNAYITDMSRTKWYKIHSWRLVDSQHVTPFRINKLQKYDEILLKNESVIYKEKHGDTYTIKKCVSIPYSSLLNIVDNLDIDVNNIISSCVVVENSICRPATENDFGMASPDK